MSNQKPKPSASAPISAPVPTSVVAADEIWEAIHALSKGKVTIPDLRNATPHFLVDELGSIKDALKRLDTLEGMYKDALNSRLPVQPTADKPEVTVKGNKKVAIAKYVEQNRFDSTRFRAEHPDLAEEYTKSISFTMLTVKDLLVDERNERTPEPNGDTGKVRNRRSGQAK